jgi:glycine cleavage system transcriptional repressor
MPKRFIMTAFGKDRPGIAADVTEILYTNGCNLEDTSMTLLADEFTLILLFTGEGEALEEVIAKDCRRLEREKGISAFMRPVEVEKSRVSKPFSMRIIHVEGVDQAGIVFKVSRYLADNQVNIVDLRSRVTASPESGTAIYIMEIMVQIPEGTDMAVLEEGLAGIADQLHVDIRLGA